MLTLRCLLPMLLLVLVLERRCLHPEHLGRHPRCPRPIYWTRRTIRCRLWRTRPRGETRRRGQVVVLLLVLPHRARRTRSWSGCTTKCTQS